MKHVQCLIKQKTNNKLKWKNMLIIWNKKVLFHLQKIMKIISMIIPSHEDFISCRYSKSALTIALAEPLPV